MIKKILKKGEKSKDEIKVDDKSVEALKAKLSQLNNTGENVTVHPANSKENQNTNQQPNQPAVQTGQIRLADAEFVADNERIINLIMQQIKELIEIDNNLNMKLKEIENKSTNITRDINQSKKTVSTFNDRLENIEKNMEKFMGLYELVTNKYNPFVQEASSEEDDEDEDDNNQNVKPQQTKREVKPLPIQNNINEAVTHAKEGIKADAEIKTNAAPNKPETPKVAAPVSPEKTAAQDKFAAMKAKINNEESTPIVSAQDTTPAVPTQNATEEAMSTMNMIAEEVQISDRLGQLEKSQAKIAGLGNSIIEEISGPSNIPEITDSLSEKNAFSNPLLHKEISTAYHLETEDGRTIQTLNDFVGLLHEMNDNELHEHIITQKDNYAQWLDLALEDSELTARFNSSENSKLGIISSLVTK